MTVRTVFIWLAAALLGGLGWYAMVPVWTQGLGGAAIGSDAQPALWMTAARAACLTSVGAMAYCVLTRPKTREGRRAGFERALGLGFGATVTATILYLAMAGQPLRVWYLLLHGRWDSPFTAGGVALLVSGVYFMSAGRLPRWAGVLLALAGIAAFFEILLPFYGDFTIPACIDWAVLAFALSCGAFAAWMRLGRTSQSVPAQDDLKLSLTK